MVSMFFHFLLLCLLASAASTSVSNAIRSNAIRSKSKTKMGTQMKMFTTCDAECFKIINARAEKISQSVTGEQRKWGLIDVLDTVADLQEDGAHVQGITAKIMMTIVASFHALYDNAVPNMRALLLQKWSRLKKSSEEVTGSLQSQNWVVWNEMKKAAQALTMQKVRPFCQLLPAMRVGGGLLVSMSVDIPLAGICATGINYCIGRAFGGFKKVLEGWLKEANTITMLGKDMAVFISKILFTPLARAIDYLSSPAMAPMLKGILQRIAEWVKKQIMSLGLSTSFLNSKVMKELDTRIESYKGVICSGEGSTLCFASNSIQLISMLIDPLVLKNAMLGYGVEFLGYQVKAIQSFILGEEKDHSKVDPEEQKDTVRFIEIGNTHHSLKKFYLSNDILLHSSSYIYSGSLRKFHDHGRHLLMTNKADTKCVGFDLITTVMCAVNIKASQIRKNCEEQCHMEEDATKVIKWTPTELLDTRNIDIVKNHPDYGYGTQAGMFSVIAASFHMIFDDFVPDFRTLAMDKYSDFRQDLMTLASDGSASKSPEEEAKAKEQIGTLLKGHDFSIGRFALM